MGPQGETLDWSDVIAESRIDEAVYAIGLAFDARDGSRLFVAVGTGFAAYYTQALWTNAHVINGLLEDFGQLEAAGRDPAALAVRAGTPVGEDGTYRINVTDEPWIHPDYDGTVSSEDIGILDIGGELPVGLNLLPRQMVNDVVIGQPVGTLGFPGALDVAGGAAGDIATPTFKDGVVSALRAIDSGESQHVEMQYNFDTSGGTSGSPVFDHDGWVVAVNHAHIVTRVLHESGQVVRVGLGSLNFGIRVDAVWDFLDHVEAGRAQAPPADGQPTRQRTYPFDAYRPFPDNWNGETTPPR